LIVVDASIVVTALADDGSDGARCRDRIAGEQLVAPHLIDLEVVSAWRRLAAAGQLDDRRAEFARTDLRDLPIRRVAHGPLVERGWALRTTMTTYDAAYVALAELLDVPLLTADAKLAASRGATCRIELLR
jgi:predicted nucleic acid-binding protein